MASRWPLRLAPAALGVRLHRQCCRRAAAAIQLHVPHASIGMPSPHGELGIAGAALAPAPAPEAPLPEPPPPELPLDVEPLAPPPVAVVLCVAPVSLQYVGSWLQT
jgi:hypothetical protein